MAQRKHIAVSEDTYRQFMEYSDGRGSTQSEAIAALLSAAVNTGVNTELTDKLTPVNTDLTAENTELREQTTALQADVNALTAELTRVNAELTDRLTRVNTLDNAANTANDTILQLENGNRELTERVNTLALGVKNLEDDLSSGANIRRKIGEYRWKMLRYSSFVRSKKRGEQLTPMDVIDKILNEYYEHELIEGSMAIPDREMRRRLKERIHE